MTTKVKRNLFGTDGIRAVANIPPMTAETAMKVGKAMGFVAGRRGDRSLRKRPMIVIGKDTRRSCYMLENALAAGICSMGADAVMVGPMPTPAISFLTRDMRAETGIVISASHNAYYDNGIKIFSKDGFKLPDSMEAELEQIIETESYLKNVPTHDGIGKAQRIDDASGRYVVFCKSTFPSSFTLKGIRIVLDCAHGAAYKVAPSVFEELDAEVIRMGCEPNGLNINDQCGALYAQNVADAVTEYRADIGISLDGDGDRVILSDELGQIVNGDHIMAICGSEMLKHDELPGSTIVTTPMSNLGLKLAIEKHGGKIAIADVGDRYVVDMMRKNNYRMGGEQSGHIVFLDSGTTGDGIIAALKVLAQMIGKGKKLSELRSVMEEFPQVLKNIKITKKKPLENMPDVNKKIDAARKDLGDSGRVFVRFSGTEPLARVLVEGRDMKHITILAEDIATSIRNELG